MSSSQIPFQKQNDGATKHFHFRGNGTRFQSQNAGQITDSEANSSYSSVVSSSQVWWSKWWCKFISVLKHTPFLDCPFLDCHGLHFHSLLVSIFPADFLSLLFGTLMLILSLLQCLSPAGEYNLRLGIIKELHPDMVATYSGRLYFTLHFLDPHGTSINLRYWNGSWMVGLKLVQCSSIWRPPFYCWSWSQCWWKRC